MHKERLKKAEAFTPKSLSCFSMMITMATQTMVMMMMVVIMLLIYSRCFCVYSAHGRHAPVHVCVIGRVFCPTQTTRNSTTLSINARFQNLRQAFSRTRTYILSCVKMRQGFPRTTEAKTTQSRFANSANTKWVLSHTGQVERIWEILASPRKSTCLKPRQKRVKAHVAGT